VRGSVLAFCFAFSALYAPFTLFFWISRLIVLGLR
jgi:hypothetical protein